MPARGQTQSLRLLEQVGVLAAGHFQVVEVGGRRPRARLERSVHGADVFPVAADLDQSPVIDAAVARGEAQRLDDRAQAGLRGQARHRGHGPVGDVEPDLGTLEDAGGLGPADVMRVEVDRQADLLTQGLDQFPGGERLAQAGHVLDGDQVRPALLQLAGHRDDST